MFIDDSSEATKSLISSNTSLLPEGGLWIQAGSILVLLREGGMLGQLRNSGPSLCADEDGVTGDLGKGQILTRGH